MTLLTHCLSSCLVLCTPSLLRVCECAHRSTRAYTLTHIHALSPLLSVKTAKFFTVEFTLMCLFFFFLYFSSFSRSDTKWSKGSEPRAVSWCPPIANHSHWDDGSHKVREELAGQSAWVVGRSLCPLGSSNTLFSEVKGQHTRPNTLIIILSCEQTR